MACGALCGPARQQPAPAWVARMRYTLRSETGPPQWAAPGWDSLPEVTRCTTVTHSRALSCESRNRLACRPPANPVRSPLDPMTRWQGATIEIGFQPLAAPTARAAPGLPIALATSA